MSNWTTPGWRPFTAQWPGFETWLETHQLPLITFEEA